MPKHKRLGLKGDRTALTWAKSQRALSAGSGPGPDQGGQERASDLVAAGTSGVTPAGGVTLEQRAAMLMAQPERVVGRHLGAAMGRPRRPGLRPAPPVP